MTVALLVAVAANGVIGRDGAIPWHLREDLARFKQLTLGHVLVMGRRTYESIGRPLPGRTTIVVTRDTSWTAAGVTTAASPTEALDAARAVDDTVFVVGGTEIYRGALPYADRIYRTELEADHDGDTYFPDVDWSRWEAVARVERDGFAFVEYHRRDVERDSGGQPLRS